MVVSNSISQAGAVPVSSLPQRVYRLRWRFDFLDKPSEVGIWNSSAKSAWSINKNGLIRAVIEGERLDNHQMATLFECDGHEYATAEWDVFAFGGRFGQGEFKPRPHVGGLSFYTNRERISVDVSGEVTRRPLREDEEGFFLDQYRY